LVKNDEDPKEPKTHYPTGEMGEKYNAVMPEWKTPFSTSIMMAPRPTKFKMPTIEAFDGTSDPEEHLATYKHLMYFQGPDDATWCRYFLSTLKGIAQKWFNSLPDHSINNFNELSSIFVHHFMANKREKKTSMHLAKIVQGDKESLRSYVQRFNLESLQIPNISEGVAFDNFFRGLRDGTFKFDVVRRNCKTLKGILEEAECFIHAQELCASTRKDKRDDKRNFQTSNVPVPIFPL